MRTVIPAALIAVAASIALSASGAFADSTSSTSGGGANVSIVTGSNGGTTIVIDSNKPCHMTGSGSASRGSASSHSTRVETGPGGLSGSTSIGPNGPSVSI